jgi:hypothetical protein
MDVFLQGEWFEFRFPKGKILKLKLKPVPYQEQGKWEKYGRDNFFEPVMDFIIDWEGLTEDGEKVEPTPENIKKYIPYFLLSEVEHVGKEEKEAVKESGPTEEEPIIKIGKPLGIYLLDILRNIENFLGN